MKLKFAVTSLALMAAMALPAMAQDRGWYDQNGVYHQDRDRDRDRDDRWHRDHDRDHDRDNGYYNNGYYNGGYNNGRYNNGYGNPGFRMGMQDGLNDGRTARANGRSSYGPGWKHPDRGYSSGMGDKNQYKQQYRAGYQQGFQQGMNSGGYNRGPWGR